jgi:muramoyltetrapeptide carboxypeptidase
VAVVAPASAASRARTLRGAKQLERLGYRVKVFPQALARAGRFAGSDQRRAAALVKALRDPSLKAILFVRGGFGAARILPLVERDLRRLPPKILVGYSDATSLLAFVTAKLGWVTFHGPMVATDLPKLAPRYGRELAATLCGTPPPPFELAATLRAGVAEGRLLGGCLSILVTLLGTPYAPDFRQSLLFLEDVNEEPYQLDRMLTHLRQAGVLGGVAGIVFAEMANCGTRREILDVLTERTRDLGVPVAFGLPSGHGRGKRTLPLGVRARLDAGRRTLEILGPVVEAK